MTSVTTVVTEVTRQTARLAVISTAPAVTSRPAQPAPGALERGRVLVTLLQLTSSVTTCHPGTLAHIHTATLYPLLNHEPLQELANLK